MRWAKVDVTFATPAEDDETDHDVLRRVRKALAAGLTLRRGVGVYPPEVLTALADVDTPKKKRGAER